jgi:hypothetical protein
MKGKQIYIEIIIIFTHRFKLVQMNDTGSVGSKIVQ